MSLDAEEVVVLDVGVDVVAAGSIVILILVITPMDFQEGTDPLKREKEGSKLKGVAMVDLEVLSVGVAVVVLTMESLEKENALAGSMIVVVLMMESLEKENALAGSMIAVVGLDVG